MLLHEKNSKEDFKKRILLSLVFVVLIFLIILSRLCYLQLLHGKSFRNLSENNRIRIRKIPAPRGIIFDRNGNILVDNYPSFSLSITPEDVPDSKAILEGLSHLIDTPVENFMEKLDNASDYPPFKPVRLKADLNKKEIAVIETNKLDLPGITIDIEPKRFYLHENLAAHLIGYIGKISKSELRSKAYADYNMSDILGKYGIEYKYESLLRGKEGGRQIEVDAAGRELRVLGKLAPTPGKNIYLTIDSHLQKVVENLLVDKKGCVVAIDPNSGEVLAMASSPTFNPNQFSKGISFEEWHELITNPYHPLENKAIQGQYPPGSIFKIITAIAALEEQVITTETEIYCKGFYRLGRRNFRCWKRPGHGYVKLHKAIVESCDTFFYQVGKELGVDRIASYSFLFGLGEKTGISLANEKKGLVPTKKWKLKTYKYPWQGGETLSVAIGQGFVSVTPIQMVNLVSAVANCGIIYRPQIVKRIESTNHDIIREFPPEILIKLPFKSTTFDIMKNALSGVVNEPRGTGKRTKIKGVIVAGKTGTAQVVGMKDDDENIDEESIPFRLRDHAWFVAFAPVEKPEIAVVVLVEHGGHGSSSAAPLAKEIILESLKVSVN